MHIILFKAKIKASNFFFSKFNIDFYTNICSNSFNNFKKELKIKSENKLKISMIFINSSTMEFFFLPFPFC